MANTVSIKELAYLLIDNVNGGIPTDDQKLNYRVAKKYILLGLGKALRRIWFENKNNSDENYIGKTTSKEVEVKFDSEAGSYYIESLGESIDMGGMRSFSVSPVTRNSRWALRYVPITISEAFVQKGLKPVPNVIQFYKDNDRFYFTNGIMEGIYKVRLTQSNLVPTEDDDSVPLEAVNDTFAEALRLVNNEILTPSDRSNDGVPLN